MVIIVVIAVEVVVGEGLTMQLVEIIVSENIIS